MLAGVHELQRRVRRRLWYLKDLCESTSIPHLKKSRQWHFLILQKSWGEDVNKDYEVLRV